MDIETLNTRRSQTVAAREADSEVLNARLLRDAVREAGLFQRSVLGHLDHQEWRDRVRMDGQRLVDLLAEIGFRPSERPLRKSA